MMDAGCHFLLDAAAGFGAEEKRAVDRFGEGALAGFVGAADQVARMIEGNGEFLVDPIISKSDERRRIGTGG